MTLKLQGLEKWSLLTDRDPKDSAAYKDASWFMIIWKECRDSMVSFCHDCRFEVAKKTKLMYSSDSFWITTESIYLASIVKTKMMHLVYDNSSGKTKRHIFDQIKIYKKRLHRIYLKWCFHIRPLMNFNFWIFN